MPNGTVITGNIGGKTGKKIGIKLHTSPRSMEPMLPTRSPEPANLALDLVREAGSLTARISEETARVIGDLLRSMNSYYSNLIEGHQTFPLDIEKSLQRDYTADPKKRSMQTLARAHIEAEEAMVARLRQNPDLNIFAPDFLKNLHYDFYSRLPDTDEFFSIRDPDTGREERVVPGEFRKHEVRVGNHIPPAAKALPDFLRRFEESHGGLRYDTDRIVAVAASHHRLSWIHPFADGNGRVIRLFTRAFLIKTRLDADGMWSPSRGLAGHRDAYYKFLIGADMSRKSDTDGRGAPSGGELSRFCRYFLKTCLDQIDFMRECLSLENMEKRILKFLRTATDVREEAFYLIRDLFLRGQIPRGEVPRITGLKERTARSLLAELLDKRLVGSDSPKGALRFAVPLEAVDYYFPRLYPPGVIQVD